MSVLDLVRKVMKDKKIDAYMVLSGDYHNSEYVSDFFKVRQYISGFTGSAGTLVITTEKAGLWTDGRYFIQAAKELEGTGIDLYKSGMPKVPTIEEFCRENLKSGSTLYVDGKTLSYEDGKKIREYLEKASVRMLTEEDIIGEVWKDRPKMPCSKAYSLDIKYVGETREEKLLKLRKELEKNACDVYVFTSVDDICWLLNIRGNDVKYNPVILSYMVVTKEKAFLYIADEAMGDSLKKELSDIEIRTYMDIYADICKPKESFGCEKNIAFDGRKTNYSIANTLMQYEGTKDFPNPVINLKAIKNFIELENIKKAHIMDGAALCRFICYMKKRGYSEKKNEYELGKMISEYRGREETYMGESFEPIVAFGENGAMCHYSATEEKSSVVEGDGFLLFDTGGQYLLGTTDVTRTIAVGKVTEEMKRHYTAVLKGNLRLGAVKFPKGVRGINLDVLARSALWEMGLDYNHGTGHGVGYFLNVHEGPNSIRFKGNDTVVLEEGMLTSNEPGYYAEGKYGIRIENLVVCRNTETTEYGQFMEFETVTMVPFDLDCIDACSLSEREKALLNDYHAQVYENVSPYLNLEEKEWLKEMTRKI